MLVYQRVRHDFPIFSYENCHNLGSTHQFVDQTARNFACCGMAPQTVMKQRRSTSDLVAAICVNMVDFEGMI